MLRLHISTIYASVAIKKELIISTGVSTKVYNFNKNKGFFFLSTIRYIHIDTHLIQFYFIAKNYFCCKDIFYYILFFIFIVRTYILCSEEERNACWFRKKHQGE